MIDILLAGIGGQGTVLAAKILAQTAQNRGWAVRTAETIGMAQRGGSVTSHIRMGNNGEEVHSPLLEKGTATMMIAFEPGEAARNLDYLAPNGTLVTATSAVQPVTSALSKEPYASKMILEELANSMSFESEGASSGWGTVWESHDDDSVTLIAVDDKMFLDEIRNHRMLNTVLLANAICLGKIPLTLDDLKNAIRATVKPHFVELNLEAVDLVASKHCAEGQ